MFAMLKRPLIVADKWVVISFLVALATLHAGQIGLPPFLLGPAAVCYGTKIILFLQRPKTKADPEQPKNDSNTTRKRGWRWHGSLFYHFILNLLINGVFSSTTSYLCTYRMVRTHTHYIHTYIHTILEICALTPSVSCFMRLVGDKANGLGDKSVAWGLVWMLAPTHIVRYHPICLRH